ncbi:MAG: sugar transferase [Candidatus Eremiobacteraeota bacterium]|nr:sugar transferase [Candidatus Eremiobacteraeota bacterium]
MRRGRLDDMNLTNLLDMELLIPQRPAIEPHVFAQRVVPAHWIVLKRLTDIILGLVLLLLCAPFIAMAAVAIMIVSPGSPFYVQERVGLRGRVFRMYKLRTMVAGAHQMRDKLRHLNEVDGPVFKIRNDPRLHGFGALLRKLSIDEMPNFINVLRGQMSIVGPRPPLPSEVAHYSDYAARRLSVKPGVTCLWQISGRSNTSFEEWMVLDNLYIDTWTPLGDLGIIAKTVPAVLTGVGAH